MNELVSRAISVMGIIATLFLILAMASLIYNYVLESDKADPTVKEVRNRAFVRLYIDLTKIFSPLLGIFLSLVLTPTILFLILLILISPSKPVFYGHLRYTLFRRRPAISVKFKTFTREKESGEFIYTGIGRVLENTGLATLPSIFSLIMRHYSLVGLTTIPSAYNKNVDDIYRSNKLYKVHLHKEIRPGLISLFSVYNIDYEKEIRQQYLSGSLNHYNPENILIKMLNYDLYYINNKSFKLDCKIIWRALIIKLNSSTTYKIVNDDVLQKIQEGDIMPIKSLLK